MPSSPVSRRDSWKSTRRKEDDDDNDDNNDNGQTARRRRDDLQRESSLNLQDIFVTLQEQANNSSEEERARKKTMDQARHSKSTQAFMATTTKERSTPRRSKSGAAQRGTPERTDTSSSPNNSGPTAPRSAAKQPQRRQRGRRVLRSSVRTSTTTNNNANNTNNNANNNNANNNTPTTTTIPPIRTHSYGSSRSLRSSPSTAIAPNNTTTNHTSDLHNSATGSLLSFLSYDNATAQKNNSHPPLDTDEVSRADLFLQGLRDEQQQQQQQYLSNSHGGRSNNNNNNNNSAPSGLFSSSRIAQHLAATQQQQPPKDDEDEEDAATLLTYRRQAERDQRRDKMRNRMRRERQQQRQSKERKQQQQQKQRQKQQSQPQPQQLFHAGGDHGDEETKLMGSSPQHERTAKRPGLPRNSPGPPPLPQEPPRRNMALSPGSTPRHVPQEPPPRNLALSPGPPPRHDPPPLPRDLAKPSSTELSPLKQRTKELHRQRQLLEEQQQQGKSKSSKPKSSPQKSGRLSQKQPKQQQQQQQRPPTKQQQQKPKSQSDIYYVSSDPEDEDEDDERAFGDNSSSGGSSSDEDHHHLPDDSTVLQFDPTQENSVYLAKQTHHENSDVEISDGTGSVSRISIGGVEDPMALAQQHSWTSSAPPKPLFDFLEGEERGATMAQSYKDDNEQDEELVSGFGTDQDDLSDAAETLPSILHNSPVKASLTQKDGKVVVAKTTQPSENTKDNSNNNKGLVGDAQKYAQFLTQSLQPRRRKTKTPVGDGTIASAAARPKKSTKKSGKKKSLGQRLKQQQQPTLNRAGSSKSLWETDRVNVNDDDLVASTSPPAIQPSRSGGTHLKAPSLTQNEVPVYPNSMMEDPTLNGSISNVELSDDEDDLDESFNPKPPKLQDFFPKGASSNAMTTPHGDEDEEKTFVKPPSITASITGSLMSPSGGESASTESPHREKQLTKKLSRKKQASPSKNSKNNKNSAANALEKAWEMDDGGTSRKDQRLEDPMQAASDTAASPRAARSKRMSTGLASSIGRYFSSNRGRGKDGNTTADEDDEDEDEEDGGGSVSSFVSRGLFSSFRNSGRGGAAAPILLGDDSSSYESSSANTR